jgi:hypothetical protein
MDRIRSMKFNAKPIKVVTLEEYLKAIEEIQRLNAELKLFRFYASVECSKCESGRVTLFTKGPECLQCETTRTKDEF